MMRKLLFIIGILTFFLSSCGSTLEVTVNFDSNGGSEVPSQIFNEESIFTLPNVPTKEGYTFVVWHLDETLETPFSVEGVLALEPVDTLTLYASWMINKYTITFDTDGGSTVSTITQDYNTPISVPSNPTKEGYTFDGWSQTVPSTMPSENQTLKAIWKVNQYTITFDTDGGTTFSAITQDFGTTLVLQDEEPTKQNFIFIGWSPSLPTTMPSSNLSVKALWEFDPEIVGSAPVYQGMDISDNSTTALTMRSSYRYVHQTASLNDEIPLIDIPEQPDFIYFAARNEDVFVNIILNNPDSQVILRFKLNGVIYQSFQFEQGSNSELLIVKVNAGDLSGIKELTIDEIKYVENVSNLIKDAEFDGDRTITMGVTYDNPTQVEMFNTSISPTQIELYFTINDLDQLITLYENAPVFYLFDGLNIIYMQPLTIGENRISYSVLNPATTYEYAIASTYDLLDGEGPQVYLARQETFTTKDIFTVSINDIQQTSFTFVYEENDTNDVGNLKTIELYKDAVLLQSLNNLELRVFNNLDANTLYQLKITYEYDINDGNGLKTLTKELSVNTAFEPLQILEITSETLTALDTSVVDVKIMLENPNQFYINGLKVNETVITVYDLNVTYTEINFRIKVDAKEKLTFVIEVNAIDFIVNGRVFNGAYDLENTLSIDVVQRLDVLKLSTSTGSNIYESINQRVDFRVLLKVFNPYDYQITRIGYKLDHHDQTIFYIDLADITYTNENEIIIDGELFGRYQYFVHIYSIEYMFEGETYATLNQIPGYDSYPIINTPWSLRLSVINISNLIEISTIQDLKNMENYKDYILMNDIDLLNIPWEPNDFVSFTFNGNGFKITGLNIEDQITESNGEYSYVYGLFGRIDNFATIYNLTISGKINITKDNENVFSDIQAGLLFGWGYSVVLENISVDGQISISGDSIRTGFVFGNTGQAHFNNIDVSGVMSVVTTTMSFSGSVGGSSGRTNFNGSILTSNAIMNIETQYQWDAYHGEIFGHISYGYDDSLIVFEGELIVKIVTASS
jgi:uncharacterized repeat protein (TIGR02543 family)